MKALLLFFCRQLQREGLLYCRQPRLVINSLLFFIMIAVFLPLTMPADPVLLKAIAPGILWIALLVAMLLASEQLFQGDFDSGVLEQFLIAAPSFTLFIAAKILVHWLLIILPVLIFCPLLGLLFHFSLKADLMLMISLVAGSPALIALAALAASFGLSLDQKGTLMGLLLFILALPIMITGSNTFATFLQGFPVSPWLAILTAISLAALVFLPFAISAIIRIKLAD